uniref:Condensin complex subunit 1 C-terminal domain-containing protein n=1 Tax=Populus davidiana TaxID=266767 RepID=A0A6M2EYT0_9ROSI
MESLVEKLCNRFSGVTDTRQWEYISYCLSQLAFTEKGMKKLIDSFKTFEHVLSEDSVMDNFKSIIIKAKKFAKPELKLCIEEFEEKLTKFHMEKKEQEVTARNAQIHQQKIGGMEGCAVARDEGEVSEGSDVIEDGEIDDPSMEEMVQSSDSEVNRSGEYSGTSSEVTGMESDGTEVQSKVASKSRATESKVKGESGDISASSRRSTRSKQR